MNQTTCIIGHQDYPNAQIPARDGIDMAIPKARTNISTVLLIAIHSHYIANCCF